MSGPVSYTAASVSLASLAVLETLPAKGPLVDSAIFSAAERHAKVLQLEKTNSKKHYNDKFVNSSHDSQPFDTSKMLIPWHKRLL